MRFMGLHSIKLNPVPFIAVVFEVVATLVCASKSTSNMLKKQMKKIKLTKILWNLKD